MSIRDAFLPVLDTYRGWLDAGWGLRQSSVLVRVISWKIAGVDATVPGAPGAVKTSVDTDLTVDGKRPKVEQISQKMIIASGGLYQDQDLKVGPITPSFNGGGFSADVLDPAMNGSREIHFKVTGPDSPDGAWYKKIGQEVVYGNFHYHLILRKSGIQNP